MTGLSLKIAIGLLAAVCTFAGIPIANAENEVRGTDISIIEKIGPSGSLRPGYFSRDKSYNGVNDYFIGSAWLTLRPEEVYGFKFYFDGFAYGQDYTRHNDTYVEAREFYFERSAGPIDLKIGRQITVWGRADKINPTDSLSVKDLTLLATDDEDQRMGLFATQATVNFPSDSLLGQSRLIGIWQPEWRSPKYPIQSVTGITLYDERPKNAENQFAVKLDTSTSSLDWSISYFDGYSKTPDLKVLAAGASGVDLGLIHNRIQVYGADFAKNLGSFGFRGEVAYTATQDQDGVDPLMQNRNLFAVLGADRTVIENFNINAQILYRHVYDFQDPSLVGSVTSQTLTRQLNLNTNQQYQDQYGYSLRPSYKLLHETLEVECALVAWTGKGNSLVRPKVTYAISDTSKLIVGAEFYHGENDTFFGRLKDTSTVFTEYRFQF